MLNLGDLPGSNDESEATAINDVGHVAGFSYGAQGIEAFLWTPESGMAGLGFLPGGGRTEALGINDLDQVVGFNIFSSTEWEAFLWDPDVGMIGLGDLPGAQHVSEAYDINNAGTVVGWSISDVAWQAMIWDVENGMRVIPPAPDGSLPGLAYAINEPGQVVGAAAAPPTWRSQTFLWDPEQGTRIIRIGVWSGAYGINDLGQIVGEYGLGQLDQRPFIWDAENGMRDLNDLVDAVSRQRYGEVGLPVSINNAGQIGLRAYGQGAILTPFVLGDMNCDGAVDAFDIEGFVTGLIDPSAYAARWPDCFADSAGDVNQDGEFDAFDIEPFVEMLSAP